MTELGERRSSARRGVLALVIAGSGLFVHCGFRQDELECEEAVTHLTDCCPGFDATKINCTHEGGCDLQNVTALPVLESQCILRESCETIVKTKVCDRLTSELADRTIQTSGVIGETRQAEDVCP